MEALRRELRARIQQKAGIYMDNESAFWYLQEREDELIEWIIEDWNKHKGDEKARQYWRVIPANLLIREWRYNAKTGLIHEKAIDKIQDICIENYCKLYINTILFGHDSLAPYVYIETHIPEDWDEEYVDNWLEDYEWYACDDRGNWRISDYATKPIGELVISLIECEDYNKKLFLIDQILSVAHQRSDIASWFVEGGSLTLSLLADSETVKN